MPRPVLIASALLALAPALAPAPAAAQRADSAALVTVLGRDTLAIERWVRAGDRVTADVAVRSPRTTLRRYVLELGADGAMRSFEERTFDPAAPERGPIRTERVEAAGAGWARTVATADSTRTATVDGPAAALPFVDLVHWPYELVTTRAVRAGARAGEATQPLLAGGRVLPFRVRWPGPTSVELTHPLRGTMTAETDAAGRLLRLDAAQTTRKVVVTRAPWMEIDARARAWAAADAAGRGIGDLSGRGREEETVAGAKITVDYGTPMKRGRTIFGAVVPYGQVWRTGANRATHFSTDRALLLGDAATGTLAVPAGEYTLFSIPAADGGVLIVNRQTGQNGTAYDAAQDLGRVPFRRAALAEPVERFTIDVEESGAGGILHIRWDDTQLSVPFTVQ
ncbi:MAG TPA: DUF2911 domain-containing protein [Longimicrobium sp.]|nr:DUF2911 domain-containing protein [Longimicrobium sp.]